MICNRIAQHRGYEVLVNFHSVKQYNHSVLHNTEKFEELMVVYKSESMKMRHEVEEERKMLQRAEVWREERVQIKLDDAKLTLDSKYAQLNKLQSDLEDFLSFHRGNSVDKESVRVAERLREVICSMKFQEMKEFSHKPPPPSDDLFAVFEELRQKEGTNEKEIGQRKGDPPSIKLWVKRDLPTQHILLRKRILVSRQWDHKVPVDVFYLALRIPQYEEFKQILIEVVQLCQQDKMRQLSVQADMNLLKAYPEYIISYLVHVLTHDPACPSIEEYEDVKALGPIYWRLHLFLSSLLGEEGLQHRFPGMEKGSFTTIVSIFRSVKCSEDVVDLNKTKTLHAIYDLGILIAKRLCQDHINVSETQMVPLPILLDAQVQNDQYENSVDSDEQMRLRCENVMAHSEALMRAEDAEVESLKSYKSERNGNGYLINLIDSPGYVDLSSEVTAALRITDGALVVVDCIEGVCAQTETVLCQALGERIRPDLTMNKMDRCFLVLQVEGEEAYQTFFRVLENANVIMATYEDLFFGDVQVYPEKGIVAFSAGLHGWTFTLSNFAKMYASKFGVDESKMMERLWGENYSDPTTKKWTIKHTGSATCKRGFVQFCYEPIKQIIKTCMTDLKDKLWPMLQKLGVTMKIDEKELMSKVLMKRAMQTWLPACNALLGMVIFHLSSPSKAQKNLVENLYEGPLDDIYATAIRNCDLEGKVAEQIRSAIEQSTSDYDNEKLQERLAKLYGGVVVLKIGVASESSADAPESLYLESVALRNSIVSGIQFATNAGPLCDAPMWGLAFIIEPYIFADNSDVANQSDQYNIFSGQVITAVKEACRAVVLQNNPRLVEAMYFCKLTTPTEQLGSPYAVLGKKRARVLREEVQEGTSLFTVHAYLPVAESIGFSNQLRSVTSSATSALLVLSHWEASSEDPFFTPKAQEEIEEFGDGSSIGPNVAKNYMLKRKLWSMAQNLILQWSLQKST